MSIGKKYHSLREAWARVYNHSIPNKVSQAIDSLASTFVGWSYREIYTCMVNSYNWYKVESLKAKRYTLQSDSMHPNKKVSITTITSTKHSCIQEIISFCC